MQRLRRFALMKIWIPLWLLIFSQGAIAQSSSAYTDSIERWHQEREAYLRSPTGWLNLEGLFWLHPGENSFGSAAGNDLVYAHPDMPAKMGSFFLEGKKVRWQSAGGHSILFDGRVTDTALLLKEGVINGPLVKQGYFCWNIIKREEKIGVRFRNTNSATVRNFKGVSRYGVDPRWKLTAILVPNEQGGIAVSNVLGQTNLEKSPGKLLFSIQGIQYSLDALDEGGDDLFIIFGDDTNQDETYPSGRFIYVKKPGADGKTEIDFNRAINPPCAFTDFATCPLPPRQNILPVPITAGEKNFSLKGK